MLGHSPVCSCFPRLFSLVNIGGAHPSFVLRDELQRLGPPRPPVAVPPGPAPSAGQGGGQRPRPQVCLPILVLQLLEAMCKPPPKVKPPSPPKEFAKPGKEAVTEEKEEPPCSPGGAVKGVVEKGRQRETAQREERVTS